jgi:hypothetical protein
MPKTKKQKEEMIRWGEYPSTIFDDDQTTNNNELGSFYNPALIG